MARRPVLLILALCEFFPRFVVTREELFVSYISKFRSNFKVGDVLEALPNSDELACSFACLRRIDCNTAIVDVNTGTCFVSRMTKQERATLRQRQHPKGGLLYMEMLGESPYMEHAVNLNKMVFLSCHDLKTRFPGAPSGVYWIAPGKHSRFQVFCDQETLGGGWTLVWSYTFTDYKNFTADANAITPQPDWSNGKPCPSSSPVSRKIPLSETQFEAMPFELWKEIGKVFLIKSNINNWYTCGACDGSLVDLRPGLIKCSVVKSVTGLCDDVAPTLLKFSMGCGPILMRPPRHKQRPSRPGGKRSTYRVGSRDSPKFIHFDSSLSRDWPVHDPCGECHSRQLKSVTNPRGNIYIR